MTIDKRHERDAAKHGQADAHHGLYFTMYAETHDDPMQRDRNDDRLEAERDGGGDVKMWRMLDEGLPGHRQCQYGRMERVDIEQRVEAILVQHQEAHQHQRTGEEMRDVEFKSVHQKLLDTNRSSVASNASIKAAPRNSGTRKTRILAMDVSKTASRSPPTVSLPI